MTLLLLKSETSLSIASWWQAAVQLINPASSMLVDETKDTSTMIVSVFFHIDPETVLTWGKAVHTRQTPSHACQPLRITRLSPGLKINRATSFCAWQCHSALTGRRLRTELPAAPDAPKLRHPHCSPSLPQTARSCH
ncbi:unnamed protein product [Pleuronectes platessa]|uniref:Uncharacterized protein n=1 Tax=Pleuronectes platessa TaxID=8262 RepID=A0A9N7TMG2_PLEPL|nr:unnamed protein product [Pleuronectes platessa]